MVVNLFPEEFPGPAVVSIVERAQISGADPVPDAVPDCSLIHPALAVKLLVMLRGDIELRPYGNHDPGIHCVNRVHHPLRVRETLPVELVASPGILLPMKPVYDNVVKRDSPAPVLGNGGKHFLLSIVFLTALPEAHSPFRHYRGLARESAATVDDLICIVTGNEVIVNALLHLAPPAHLLPDFRSYRLECPERAICHVPVRLPLDAYRIAFPFHKVVAEFVTVRIPGSPPTLRYDFIRAYPDSYIAGVIKNEIEHTVPVALQFTRVCHDSPLERYLRLESLYVAEVTPLEMVEADILLFTDKTASVRGSISPCKTAFNAIRIVERESFRKRQARCRVAETAIGIAVPEDAVASGGNHERNRNLGIVLVQFLALSLVVEFLALVLPETVDCLVRRRRVEALCDRVSLGSLHLNGAETPAACLLRQDDFPVRSNEADSSTGLVHHCRYA